MSDWVSYDGDVDDALEDAQSEVERITGRKFETGTYTNEWVTVHGNYVYPKAVPVTSVSNPNHSVVDGFGIDLGYFYQDWVTDAPKDRTQITYVGGYSAGDMPIALKKIVARIAYRQLNPIEVANVPAGATRIRVGDVEVEGRNLGSAEVVDSTIRQELRAWRHPDMLDVVV